MKKYLIAAIISLFSCSLFAQTKPEPTEQLLTRAYAKAAKENKKVFVIFHASWCGWCKKMETSMNSPKCSKLFTENYVIVHIDVLERKGKENLENPGGLDLLKKYKGETQGLPFWVILDNKGTLLADSEIRPKGASLDTIGESIGCPANENEVTYFAKLLKATSKLSDADLEIIKARFRKNEPVKPAGTN